MTTSATTTTTQADKPPTYAQRAAIAATQANERFTFTDDKRMLAALSEVALDELARNPAFAVRVRNRYEELAPQKPSKAPKAPRAVNRPRMPSPRSRPSRRCQVSNSMRPVASIPGLSSNISA